MDINTVVDIDKALESLDNINEKVEYFRKKGTLVGDQIHETPDGEKKLILGNGKRGKGPLKGIMVAYTNGEDDLVRIGFSMCHPTDKWDHVEGVYTPGFGKWIATRRGEKWISKKYAVNNRELVYKKLQYHMSDEIINKLNEELKDCIIIPDSMHESLINFIVRCKKYYKDKKFPLWAEEVV